MTLYPSPTKEMTFADWTYGMRRSVLRQMIAVVSRPGILSFAGGLPAPELFPAAEYSHALARVLATDPRAMQYSPPFQPLKTHIVRLMAQRGVACTEDQVFLTTGAQQGLDVLTRMLLNDGGTVLLEEIVYTGVQQAIAPFRPEILTVPTDIGTGLDVGAIESYLQAGARPAYIYVIPDAHNPLGVNVSLEKRERLVDLARRFGVPIVEDDPYGFLSYDGAFAPPLRALDDEWVFYLGSFSKIMAPALRLGWMIVPEALVSKLTVVKEASDLESSGLTQRAVSAYLDAGHLPSQLEKLRREYGRRRDVMLAALRRYFPAEARWTRPTGGMFIWVILPSEMDTSELLHIAVESERVAYIPGDAFAVCPASGLIGSQASYCLRLNFSHSSEEQIATGIKRLARVFHTIHQ